MCEAGGCRELVESVGGLVCVVVEWSYVSVCDECVVCEVCRVGGVRVVRVVCAVVRVCRVCVW